MISLGTQFKYVGLALGATETTETDLGDIEKPEGATRITGIKAACALEEGTAGDGCLGHARMRWSGGPVIEGIPVDIVVDQSLGVHPYSITEMIDVNIPVNIGTSGKIHCFMTLTVAQGGACFGAIYLRFE